MSMTNWFWIIYVLCLIFGAWSAYEPAQPFRRWAGNLPFFILIGLLGWKVFGGPIQ